ncbi:ubiquilin-1 isoform X1 [Etheostoma spectabile]|uniref:ubiquilin-1 isoform X1 n=1 Tax=Etheostoma spectabile TaxID=54343 RepID=UPI0013AF848E|nr:ubiquilin-1 isoform X1 [Etheostoma spectabile]
MSGAGKDEPTAPGDCQRSETIHVAVKSLTEIRDFTVRGCCTVRQLKWGLAERLGVLAEQLELSHSGRVLRESELLSHLKAQDESVSLCVIQRSQRLSAATTCDPGSEMIQSELPAGLDRDPDSFSLSPTSPLCLVEGLDSLGLTNSGPGFLPALQRPMESRLLADPEMMRRVLGSPFVQSTLSTYSPQLTRQLILSNPQIQQLLQTNPEVGDILNNTIFIKQVMEHVRNPEKENPESITGDSDRFQKTSQIHIGAPPVVTTSSGTQQPTDRESNETPPVSSPSTDPLREWTASATVDPNPQSAVTAGMQSLLEEITASPGLMESLLSGPYVSSLLNCLGQNPDLAAQMLLSHPLFSGNPQLQEQMRQQIPLFLQQMQSPELLSAMLNPRAMEALLHIQHGLQTLAAEVPTLIPIARVNATPELASDSVLTNQSGSGPCVATVTEEQQYQFVHQMLQALANTNHGVHVEEAEFQDELEHLSSMGYGD